MNPSDKIRQTKYLFIFKVTDTKEKVFNGFFSVNTSVLVGLMSLTFPPFLQTATLANFEASPKLYNPLERGAG